MALKHKVNATELALLPEVLKSEYVFQADGNYALDLGGVFVTDKDPVGLMSALEGERSEHKATKTHLTRLESERDQARKEKELAEAAKTGDVEQLKAFFKAQNEELSKQFQEQIKAEKAVVEKQRVTNAEQFRVNEANKIAAELFGKRAQLLVPHVLQNLKAIPGETPSLEFLNSAGQPDLTLNMESYKKSFLTHPLFADMVVATSASGGSANDGTHVPSSKADGTKKGFNDYSSGELVTLFTGNPAEYERLKAERNRK